MHIKDIMSSKVVVVDKDQNLNDALKLMKKHKISRLPVINTNNNHERELVGIITEKDIALRLGSSRYGNMPPSHFHVSTVMTPDPITLNAAENLGKAAKIMIENKIGGIPIIDNGEIIGIITKTDFIKTCQGIPYNKTYIKDRMQTDVMTVNPGDRLVHARRILIDEDIGRLPVMNGDEIEGILTAKDIADSMISFRKIVPDKYQAARIRNLIVEDIMTQNVRTINEEKTIADASTFMIDEDFSGVPVTNDTGEITGMITKTDLMNFIAELEEVY
ncbi:CBS domain-containing protein [Methanobacterium sp. MBAC-LM]|jgi:CBS domain-containing protein|uniref:CBS domain-containing protein n=1 Tax=Methanobacterium sp. MBAC-LM TaxID=3412034 RepID=UPI003C71AB3B